MRILLINSNPVVSRLTALSARKEGVPIDEIRDIADLKESDYNIVFIDSDSLNSEILTFLKKSNTKKRVIFHTQEDKDIDDIFNYTILKPFLPSEVSSILREAKMELDEEEYEQKTPKEEYLNLNEIISTKKDDLAPLEIKEDKKFTVLKGNEEKLLKELKVSKSKKEDKLDLNLDLDDDLLIKDDKEGTTTKSELFELDREEDKNKRDIQDEVLDLDKDSSSEVKFEEKKDTKILDKEETLNIKSLLESEEPSDRNHLSLDDVVEPTTPPIDMEIKEKKSEESKRDEVVKRVLKDTVVSLPIEELRQLLRGTKIHITIEFPKEV